MSSVWALQDAKGSFRMMYLLDTCVVSETRAKSPNAATAKVDNLTLVTRNVRDMEGMGIRLLNPFDE